MLCARDSRVYVKEDIFLKAEGSDWLETLHPSRGKTHADYLQSVEGSGGRWGGGL